MNGPHNETIPDWKCERFLLGELDHDEMEVIRRRLEQDEELRARLEELESSGRRILERYPSKMMASRITDRFAAAERRDEEPGPKRVPRIAWAPVAAAAVMAGILWLRPGPSDQPFLPGDGADVRVKGPTAELSLYRATDHGSERLEHRALAAEHDLIGARYRSDGQGYGLVVSVDGRGVVTRHYPLKGDGAAPLAAGSHALDFSYELDDAPRWEIFLLASSRDAFAVDPILQAIEASELTGGIASAAAAESVATSLRIPEGVAVSVFTLIKEAGDER